MEGQLRVRIAQILAALTALCICATAWGQPMPAPIVTEAQACGQWSEPLTIELPSDRRISIARLVELVAEDVSNAQFQTALFAAHDGFPLTRMRTREPHSMHGDSLVVMVANIVPTADEATRDAITARVRQILMHAGSGRISIEEDRMCCVVRNADGTRSCDTPVGGFCADGHPQQRISRNRFLRPSETTDNFFTGSYISGGPEVDRSSWRSESGYSFRVFVKPGSHPLTINLARVYDTEHHPRPAAVLCRELHSLKDAPPPSDAASKERIFARMAELTTATIAEGEINAAIWATGVVRDVSARVADLEALRRSEGVRTDLDARLHNRWTEIQRVRTDRDHANARTTHWQGITILLALLSVAAIAVGIFLGIRLRAAGVKREMEKFIAAFEQEVFQWRCFAEGLLGQEHEITRRIQQEFQVTELQQRVLDPGRFLTFFELVRGGVNGAVEQMKKETADINRIFLEAVSQDSVSELLGFKKVVLNGTNAQILNTPLSAPLVRRLLEGTMRALHSLKDAERARDGLRVVLEESETRLKVLTDGIHEAMAAKNFKDAETILLDTLATALSGDLATPVMGVPAGTPHGALPSG